jgi:anti-anti-sigma regulatory factor
VPFSIASRQGSLVLKLAGAVTIRDAQDLAAKLSEHLDETTPVEVDVQDLEDVDTCILQLLCSVRRSAAGFRFDNSSTEFAAAVDRCGLRRELLSTRESV